jgi:hypothetical protein
MEYLEIHDISAKELRKKFDLKKDAFFRIVP